MEYVYYTNLQNYPHQENMKTVKKDVRFVQYLLKHVIYDVFVVILSLEQNPEQTKIKKLDDVSLTMLSIF
jgi:hypothetical protein